MTQGYRSHFFSSCDNSQENTLDISEALRKSLKMRLQCLFNDDISNSRFSHCHHSTVSSWAMWKISAVQVFFMQATNSPVWLWLSAPVQISLTKNILGPFHSYKHCIAAKGARVIDKCTRFLKSQGANITDNNKYSAAHSTVKNDARTLSSL